MRRKLYRYIRAERDRLERHGIPAEALRLICRYLADLSNESAMHRARTFYMAHLELLRISGLPFPTVPRVPVLNVCDVPQEFRGKHREKLMA